MKFKLEPERRAEIMCRFSSLTREMSEIANEIGSKKMIVRLGGVGEAFYNRLAKDQNLPKSKSIEEIEAEMDDDSGEDEEEI